jgi:hypothetical protein
MRSIDRWTVLPHEIAFGAFLLATLARLIPVQGFLAPLPLLYEGMLVLIVVAVVSCRRHETRLRWHLRLGLPLALMNVAYFTLGSVIPAFHPGKEDALLQSLDAHLIRGNASLWMEQYSHPLLTDLFSACYLVYFPCLLLSCVHYFRGDLATLRRFIIGMFTVYGAGFLGYTLLPALGPYLDPTVAAQFHGPLTGGWITRFNAEVVLNGSNRVDVFPSLHCAVTLFILCFDRVHAPQRFRFWLLPVIGLWIATVYLRYHYVIDVLAGFALAAAASVMVRQTQTASTYELPSPTRRFRGLSS